MFSVYDKINDYEYAWGETITELIDNWNDYSRHNFQWILENENCEDFYNSVTEKCYRLENIEDICRIVNNVEVNCLELYENNKIIDW